MLLIDQNGVITHYQVEYNQSTFTEGASATSQTNGSVLSLLLVGLEEYVEYSIRVSAYTKVGQGPYSNATNNRTHQAGKVDVNDDYSNKCPFPHPSWKKKKLHLASHKMFLLLQKLQLLSLCLGNMLKKLIRMEL